MTQRVESMISLARRGELALRRRRGPRGGRLPGLAAARQLRPAGRARVRDQGRRVPLHPGLGARHPGRRGALGVLHAGPARRSSRRRCATSRLGGELLIVDKANARAPVHRRERMDYVGVRRVTPDGELAGEARLLGLFTTKAYPEPASETPVLHRKLRRVLEAEDLIEGSHDYKAAVALFDAFPKDELFAAPVDDLRRAVVALLALEGTDRVRLLGRRAADGRSASFILALPRERYRALLVERVRKLFKRRFQRPRRRGPAHARRGHARARALPRALAGRAARGRQRRARARGRPARPHVGRRAARRARRALRRRARAPAVVDLGHAPARALQGLHGAADRRDGHRAARAAGRDRAVPGLAAAAREPHARRALQARAEGRAGRRAADARGPRAARDRGDLDAADRRRRDVGAGVPRARPGRRAAGSSRRSASAWRSCWPPSTAATPRPTTSTGSCITAGLDRRQVAILRAYRKYRQRVGSRFTESYQNDVLVANSRGHGQARALLRAALRPGAGGRRGGRGRAARRDPRRPRRGRLARPRPDPAQPARGDRRDAAHERLQRRPRGAGVQAALRRRAGRCRSRRRSSRSTSTRPTSRASTCAAGRSPAAACAGRTARTTAPRSSG